MPEYSTNAESQAWIESIEKAWEDGVQDYMRKHPGIDRNEAEAALEQSLGDWMSTRSLPRQLSDDADALMKYWGLEIMAVQSSGQFPQLNTKPTKKTGSKKGSRKGR